MSQINALTLAMVATFNASTPVNEFVAGLQASKNIRERTLAALVAMCATMTGASRAAEIVSAFHVMNEDEFHTDTRNASEGQNVGKKFNAKSLYADIAKDVRAAGHAFTISQRTKKLDGGRKELCWIGATMEDVAKKSAAAKGPRAKRNSAKLAGGMTDKQFALQVRQLAKLEDVTHEQCLAALRVMLKGAAPAKRATFGDLSGKRPAHVATPARKSA